MSEPMEELEHTLKIIPIDDDYLIEIANLNKEGWQLMPGVKPLAIYQLIRRKGGARIAEPTGRGEMLIDESKVFVIPAVKTN